MFCHICGEKIIIEKEDIFCPFCTKVFSDDMCKELVRYNMSERFFILDHLSDKIGDIEKEMENTNKIKNQNEQLYASFNNLCIFYLTLGNFVKSLYKINLFRIFTFKKKIEKIMPDLNIKMIEMEEYLQKIPKS